MFTFNRLINNRLGPVLFMCTILLSGCNCFSGLGMKSEYKKSFKIELSKYEDRFVDCMNFSGFGIQGDDQELTDLLACLQRNHRITELCLNNNCMTGVGIKKLTEALKQCIGQIKKIEIARNGLNDEDVQQLAQVFKGGGLALENLNLSENKITYVGLAALAEALSHCSSLKVLRISSNEIGKESWGDLVQICRGCRGLQGIDISYNRLEDDPALQDFIQTVADMPSIKQVDFSSNLLGNGGVIKIVQTLLEHPGKPSLMTLDLSKNQINDQGAEKLSKLLEHKEASLATLRLNENQITTKGAITLSRALVKNTSLKMIGLRWNAFVNEEKESIRRMLDKFADAMNNNRSLVFLSLCKAPLYYKNNQGDDMKLLNDMIEHSKEEIVELIQQDRSLHDSER